MVYAVVQGAEKIRAAQQEAEALKRETALAAAALEGRTQALARQEAAAAEAKALLAVRTKELDNREARASLQSEGSHYRGLPFPMGVLFAFAISLSSL